MKALLREGSSRDLLRDYEPSCGPPFQALLLTEMGEMVCYTERCPDCGRVPPGRRQQRPPAPGPGVGRGLRRLLQQSRRQHKQGYVSRTSFLTSELVNVKAG